MTGPSIDPRDRILELALRRILAGEDDVAVDLSAEIAGAFERGERGSVTLKTGADRAAGGPPASAAPRNGHAPQDTTRTASPGRIPRAPRAPRAPSSASQAPRAARRPVAYKALAAAAAVALVGGAGWFALRSSGVPGGPGVPVPVAPGVANGRLALLVDDRFEEPPAVAGRHELAAGATFWVPAGPPADVRLVSGAELELAGASLARLVALGPEPGAGVEAPSEYALELQHGTLRATSPATAELALRAAGVELLLEPGTELELASAFEVRRPAPTGAASYAALEAESEASSLGWLTVRVRKGEASLNIGGARVALAAEGEAFVALGDTPEVVPAEEVADLIAFVNDMTYARPYPEDGLDAIGDAVRARPALWLPLEGPFEQSLRSADSSWNWRRALIDFLAYDSSATSLRIARAVWLERAEEFSDEAKIAFAERGAPEFQREAEATLAWYDADDEDADPLPAALYAALRGNDLGVPYLQEALQYFDLPAKAAPAGDRTPAARALAAAAALKRLGDPKRWEDALDWGTAGAEGALDQGLLGDAASMGIALELMSELARAVPGKAGPVSFLPQRVAARIEARVADYETEQDVRDLLARLAAD